MNSRNSAPLLIAGAFVSSLAPGAAAVAPSSLPVVLSEVLARSAEAPAADREAEWQAERLRQLAVDVAPAAAGAPSGAAGGAEAGEPVPASRRLPFLGEEARKWGYDLPLPLGAGLVYYHLDRDIAVSEVRIGRDGAEPAAVPDFVDLGSTSKVDNANAKVDAWILPFLNLYAIVGYVRNESDTTIDVALPPLVPGGPERRRSLTVPTRIEGSVGGLGVTVAGGVRSLFFALDVNGARADLGFDNKFKAVVSSGRIGWNGKVGAKPTRVWLNATYWDTFATAEGTVADPDGGTLRFEVDQGPRHPWTYGVGFQTTIRPSFEIALDTGADLDGGWYLALVPVFRF